MSIKYKGKTVSGGSKGDPGPQGPSGPDGNPIGTIISYMGITPPKDYLACDGAEYSITDHSDLAEFFETQFGAANYFGGDGTTTFAVPDLRNLFLRGYHGTAAEQLSGEIGAKQEATEHVNIWINATALIGRDSGAYRYPQNLDSRKGTYVYSYDQYDRSSNSNDPSVQDTAFYTSHPVNTAVLYCIKAVVSLPEEKEEQDAIVSETYGPASEITVDMAMPGTVLRPVSEIKLMQEGSGTPSLTNIRNLLGRNQVSISFNGESHTQSFPETVYSGSYDWAKGKLIITSKTVSFAVANMNYDENFPGWINCTWLNEIYSANFNSQPKLPINIGEYVGVTFYANGDPRWWTVFMPVTRYGMKQSEWKAQYADLTVTMSFPLLEPRVIRLTPSEFLAVNGNNILSSDTGDTTVTFQVELKKYIDKRIADVIAGAI